MKFIQRLLASVLPSSWAEDMRTESLRWMLHCPNCGFERSVWEMGGIRWKARGNRRYRVTCPQCKQRTWQTLTQKPHV